MQWIVVFAVIAAWWFAVTLLTEQIVRPLQTLSNVVAALREDDYSFRARGGRRNDALGDLALEINALASMLQGQRAGALEAMALVERVMSSMQSPVLAFDPNGRLKLLNEAAEHAFGLKKGLALHQGAHELMLDYLLETADDGVLSLGATQQTTRWVVKRSGFRLRGIPHTLFVLSDVSVALREEERVAWERLIRVLGHEINNSLAPIKSIAGSLRDRLAALPLGATEHEDFERGLEVIANRAESLNRFLQAYRQLMGLPAPALARFPLAGLVRQAAALETRLTVVDLGGPSIMVMADADQIQQALINLLRNAAEAALGPDTRSDVEPLVDIGWELDGAEIVLAIRDNGPGLLNEANLFVPFYTTKPDGTGIGLVLVKQIAEGHQGSVRLKNRSDGTGCVVEFRIPYRHEA
ncbi:sensor histidine kinase [Granulicella arctica]|uniref:sensor histidine kinase n=1 Tax=Granulicella arctica TaxID=940613 RepID=UPI0021E010BE|nr:ATP-binding protein [Granulicella arctica]